MQATLPDFRRSARYLSCAETAKLMRAALKAKFPGFAFSVRSRTYTGGSAIDVSWTDGPRQKDVAPVVAAFEGGRFDGMIDMAYSVEHWLLPDGTTALAHSPGTANSAGSCPSFVSDPPHPNAELVHFGAKYVSAQREMSDATRAAIEAGLRERYNVARGEIDPLLTLDGKTESHAMGGGTFGGRESLSTLIGREFHAQAF